MIDPEPPEIVREVPGSNELGHKECGSEASDVDDLDLPIDLNL